MRDNTDDVLRVCQFYSCYTHSCYRVRDSVAAVVLHVVTQCYIIHSKT